MNRQRRWVAALLVFAVAVAVGAFLAVGERELGSPEERTRRQLVELRGRVAAWIEAQGSSAVDVLEDMMASPLLERDGVLSIAALQKREPGRVNGAFRPSRLVHDAWGQPIVLLTDSPESERGWWLASAGADGVWTVDLPSASSLYRNLPERYWTYAPAPWHGTNGDAWVVGDDLVIDGSGRFLPRYPHPIPSTAAVLSTVRSLLDGKAPGELKADTGFVDRLGKLSPARRSEMRELLSAYPHTKRAMRAEHDPWVERMQGGFTPRLFFGDYETDTLPLWIEPRDAGWTLDGGTESLWRNLVHEIMDPSQAKAATTAAEADARLAATTTIRVAGAEFRSTAFVFVVEKVPPEHPAAARIARIVADIDRAVDSLGEEQQLAIVLSPADRRSELESWPEGYFAAQADAESREQFKTLVRSFTESPPNRAMNLALSKAMDYASSTNHRDAVIVLVLTETALTAESLDLVSARDSRERSEFTVQTILVVPPGRTAPDASLAARLAAQNGGQCVIVDSDPEPAPATEHRDANQ